LFVSEKTIKNHRHNIIQKLNLSNEKNSLLKWAANNTDI
ncbi:MAG: response regulator transcription factor, partial [Sediminibacterium sp.]|nr:response regulator transcription factor [Sediminibacterium sp.]